MQDIKRNVMNAIKMNRLELLGIVRANLIEHVSMFNESVTDFKALVLGIAKDNLELAYVGEMSSIKKIKPLPSMPVSYESSYKRAIRMLELCVDDHIEIEEDVFNQLVLDEWHWKHSFIASNTMYKSGG